MIPGQIVARKGRPGFTTFSITDETPLLRDRARIRDRGFAIDDQERAEGMRCVAAPIFNAYGEPVAGLSVSGPAFRLPLSATDRIGALVRAAADQVTEATGGDPPGDHRSGDATGMARSFDGTTNDSRNRSRPTVGGVSEADL